MGSSQRNGGENEQTSDVRGDGGAERVEGLREIQAAGGGLGRSKDDHIGIGGNLQQRHASRDNSQRHQKQRKGWNHGRWKKTERADRHDQQACHHGPLVADPINHFAGGKREDEIAGEEEGLHQHDFGIVQREEMLQVRDQNVVEAGDESPQEEERNHHGKRGFAARR